MAITFEEVVNVLNQDPEMSEQKFRELMTSLTLRDQLLRAEARAANAQKDAADANTAAQAIVSEATTAQEEAQKALNAYYASLES